MNDADVFALIFAVVSYIYFCCGTETTSEVLTLSLKELQIKKKKYIYYCSLLRSLLQPHCLCFVVAAVAVTAFAMH